VKPSARRARITAAVSLAASLLLALWTLSCGGQKNGRADLASLLEEPVEAKMASAEIEGDFMTVWANRFASHLREETDGKYDITVYPYGSLGDTRTLNELAQIGAVELVFTDYAWISSFVPEVQVLSLHYLWPRERLPEVLQWVVQNGDIMPRLEGSFEERGLVPLGILFEGWQWVTSTEEIATLEQMRGLKTRVMGSRILVETYRAYGMHPVLLDYGEVYSGLETGLIDAQINPLFANSSMRFYEVSDHFTQMWAEPFLSIPAVNRQHFEQLPGEMRRAMKGYFRERVVESSDWAARRNEHARSRISESRPEIVWTEWGGEEMGEAIEVAAAVREEEYGDAVGEEAQRLLRILRRDITRAKRELGVE
jgi:TRAP-type C4-dicarboxylate transport system substrate-binding protein